MSKTSHLQRCEASLNLWQRAWFQFKHRDSRERALRTLEAFALEQRQALLREQQEQQARNRDAAMAICAAKARRHAAKVLRGLEIFAKPTPVNPRLVPRRSYPAPD